MLRDVESLGGRVVLAAAPWAALGGQTPVAGLTQFPCCPQQLNAIIAASMSLKSSSKLRNILEVRGARPRPHWGEVWPGRVHVGGADLPHAS